MSRRINVAANRVVLPVGLAFVALALCLDIAIRHDPISVDFHTYLAAARVGLHDGWSHVYDQGLVAVEQRRLDPSLTVQPFLSPPTVAFLSAPLATLPFHVAYVVWAVLTSLAFAGALAWAGISRGLAVWVGAAGALAPWWVMHAVNLGQVVPLVAAGTVVAWRLIRDRRDVAAGVALIVVLLKPNTVVLVPFALLFAARFRTFVAWAAAVAFVGAATTLVVGVDGLSAYIAQIRGPLPSGADNLTLHGAFGVGGAAAAVLRVAIVGAVLAASFALRRSPDLMMPLAIVGSLVVAPYLHASDLCLFAAAAWMVWEARPAWAWRSPIAAGWVLASPFVYLGDAGPRLNQWTWVEIALIVALVAAAAWPLTGWADSRSRAPA